MTRPHLVLHEAATVVRSQPIPSFVMILILASMVVAIMLTTGRTATAEQQVLSTIDSVGTRSIVIRADEGAGVTSGVLDRISRIEGIDRASAFSGATDVANTHLADGARVPLRFAYGVDDLWTEARTAPGSSPATAYASPNALARLGMLHPSGSVTGAAGAEYDIRGMPDVPGFLTGLEPLLLLPRSVDDGSDPVRIIIVVAASPELVSPLSKAAVSVLGADDPTKVTVQTSERLAQLHALVEAQLAGFSRGLVIAIAALTGGIAGVVQAGLVLLRRKDFGRRRALGATRAFIVQLILTQTILLAFAGIGIGIAVSCTVLLAESAVLPRCDFSFAVAVVSLATAVISAVLPAVLASRRDPVRELRTP